nr:MAG: replication associated protein [Cressdnaviricota sp.]
MEQSVRNSQGGNTSTPCLKSRAYILTIFEGEIIHFDKSIYECWCDDTCEDGKPHKHHLIYFKNPISFKTIKKVYPKAHIERCHSIEDSINYIMLNEKGRKFNIEERGKRPQKHKFETMADLKDEDSDDIPPYMYSAYSKYKHKPKPIKTSEWLKHVKVYYISGPSGIGKSSKAYDLLVEHNIEEFDEISYENGFYLGATGAAKACIFDDFRDSRMKPDEFIRFIDYRRHTMNIKGGQVVNDYEFIIITSIKPVEELYKNVKEEQREQWLRRLDVIDLTPIDEDAL